MSKKELRMEYKITPSTMAILFNKEGDDIKGAVLEEAREYKIPITPTKFMDYACQLYGSSLEGRVIGSRKISNITHKVPITIDPSNGMYFFPTTSPKRKNCSWISHTHIQSYAAYKTSKTQIFFNNGTSVVVDVSLNSFENQVQRTAQLRFILENRINEYKVSDGNF